MKKVLRRFLKCLNVFEIQGVEENFYFYLFKKIVTGVFKFIQKITQVLCNQFLSDRKLT